MEVELIEKATCNVSNTDSNNRMKHSMNVNKKIILVLHGVIVDSKRVVLSEYG